MDGMTNVIFWRWYVVLLTTKMVSLDITGSSLAGMDLIRYGLDNQATIDKLKLRCIYLFFFDTLVFSLTSDRYSFY